MLTNDETEHTLLVTPEMANFHGNMHGGELLKILDKVAYICATRYCESYTVTLSVDQVTFKQSIKIGELLTFLAKVNYTGTTSMEVGIKVIAENLQKKHVRHTNTCYFTMVAVDENGKTIPVPEFAPKAPEEIKRHTAALARREIRLANRK